TSLATLAATKRLEIGPELCSGFCVSRASPKPRGSSKGAIAQLGERLHGMQEVGGSIPPGSTTLRLRLRVAQPRSSRRRSVPGVAPLGEDGLPDATRYYCRSSAHSGYGWRSHERAERAKRPRRSPLGRRRAARRYPILLSIISTFGLRVAQPRKSLKGEACPANPPWAKTGCQTLPDIIIHHQHIRATRGAATQEPEGRSVPGIARRATTGWRDRPIPSTI